MDEDKVTVSGNVDPSTLINKLEKAGKHAELLGPKKGPIPVMTNQFKSFQIENTNGGKDSKPQKGFREQNKGGVVQAPHHHHHHQQQQQQNKQMMNLKKGSMDVGVVGKDRNTVRFRLPEDEDEDDDDMFDEDEDDFDDESDDDDYGAHHLPIKAAPVVVSKESKKATPKGHLKGKDNHGKKVGGGGGGGINTFLKGMLGKAGGKNGKVGKGGKGNKAAGHPNEGAKKKGKNDQDPVFEKAKKGEATGNKKMGENLNFQGGHKLESKQQQGFNEMNANHRGGGDRGRVMGDFPAAQGLPAMNFGGQGINPYNNQQYMANMMMMMNQQGGNRHDGYHPLGYGRPPAMGYGPPPMAAGDPYTHIFSDENTDSCSIM